MKSIAKKADKALGRAFVNLRTALICRRAEGYVDSAVKILIAVVIGALLLAGLYVLFNDTVMPTVTEKIQDLFDKVPEVGSIINPAG